LLESATPAIDRGEGGAMLRIIGILLGVCIIAFIFGFKLLVSSEVGSTHLDKGVKSDSLVVLLHGMAGPESISTLKKLVRGQFPDADILTSSYSASLVSNIDPYRLTNTIEQRIHEADQQAKYEKIILVGHSLGAVLLRKALVWGLGAEQDRAPKFGSKGRRSWPDKTVRFISLAGINRGWSLDPKPANLSYPKFILAHIGVFIAELTGTGDLLLATRRGAPFISDLRVQWIQLARQQVYKGGLRKLPLSIHLIGDIDDVVTRDDSQDLAAAKDARFITLLNTGHVNLVTDLMSGNDASERLRQIKNALILPEEELPFDKLPVDNEDTQIERVIYILHGIRDYGTWGERLRAEIEKNAPRSVAVTPPKYGYFPMLSFIVFPDRQRNVRRFMDEYTENLARYPHAEVFDFVGHSNGTYILASALERYSTLKVRNVFLREALCQNTTDGAPWWRKDE
jgi:predicted alpha/beta hydrolase family esterase